MSHFQNVQSPASQAILKLVQHYDQRIKSVSDLKSGATLLNLFFELNLAPVKPSIPGKNPFQFMKKCVKKSPEKDLFQNVNFELCDKGIESELLGLSSCLLNQYYSQQKENVSQPHDVLSEQQVKILWTIWMQLEPISFLSQPTKLSRKSEPLKLYNTPHLGSPNKQRNCDTPFGLKKEIHRKDVCITNLRSLLDEDQERISDLLQTNKVHESKISRLDKLVKEQQEKLQTLNETCKLSHEVEDFQETIKSLTRENEKLLLRCKDLKDSKREIAVLETENEDLRNTKDNLNTKVSNLEDLNKRLCTRLQDLEKKQYETVVFQQHLDILNEELKVKEEAIKELNNMIAVYQDRLDVERTATSFANLDTSERGEVLGIVCSPFHNTSNELTTLQNEVNCLQSEVEELQSKLKESESMYQKSSSDVTKLEKEVDTIQRLVDHLNQEVQENQTYISNLDNQIEMKDKTITEMKQEKEDLLCEIRKLKINMKDTKKQLRKLESDQEEVCKTVQQKEDQIEKAEQNIDCLEKSLCSTKKENSELLEQVDSLNEMCSSLRIQVASSNSKVEILSYQLRDLEHSVGQLKGINVEQIEKLNSLKQEKIDLETALSVFHEKYSCLQSSFEKTTSEKENVLIELNNLREEYHELKTRDKKMQIELDSLQKENDNLMKKVAEKDSENQKLIRTVSELKTENSLLSKELQNMRSEMVVIQNQTRCLHEEVEQLLAVRNDLQKNVDELRSKNMDLATQYKCSLKTIEDVSVELIATKDDVLALTQMQGELKSEFSTLKSENNKLEVKYKESVLKNQTYEEEIDTLTKEFSAAKEDISVLSMKTEVDFLKLSKLTDEIHQARETNSSLSLQNETLTNQKSVNAIKAAQLEQEVNSLHHMTTILTDQITELVSEKLLLQVQLKQTEQKVDANTSACSFSLSDTDMSNECSSYSSINDRDVIIEDLEKDLKILEERYKEGLNEKTNEIRELMQKIETLLLDLKGKEKYLEYLELEKQQALEKFNQTLANKENDTEILSMKYTGEIKALQTQIETLNNELTLQKDCSSREVAGYDQKVESLQMNLDIILSEKSQIISALCEKEESLRLMQESLNEVNLANSKMASLITSNSEKLSAVQKNLELKSAEAVHLASELEHKTAELRQLCCLKTELNETKAMMDGYQKQYAEDVEILKNKIECCLSDNQKLSEAFESKSKMAGELKGELVMCRNRMICYEEKYAKEVNTLQNELVSCKDKNQSLVDDLTSKDEIISQITEKLEKTSQANDLLVAETLLEAKQIVGMKQDLQAYGSELENLKSLVDSYRQNEGMLQDTIAELTSNLEISLNKEKKLEDELSTSRCVNSKNEELLSCLNEKTEALQESIKKSRMLVDRKEHLEVELQNKTKEIKDLNKLVSIQKSAQDNVEIRKSTMNEIQNPALKQWLEQFDSLAEKIKEMRSNHVLELLQQNCEVGGFENNILTMIRDHIHSWFTHSEFLFQEPSEVSKLIKNSLEQLNNEKQCISCKQEKSKVASNNSSTDSAETICSQETSPELCRSCRSGVEKDLLKKELAETRGAASAVHDKMVLMKRKLDSKEREVPLLREALLIQKQKAEDVKQQLALAREQNKLLEAKSEFAQAKLQEMDKKYLEEMRTVHKKYQEKINILNSTSKDLCEVKMELVNLRKQNCDIVEMHELSETKLKNANLSLKKQRIENETLKTELKNMQRVVQQRKEQEYPARRMSMVPSTNFMQQSFCSSVDVSMDSSVFLKPMIPPSRFACDEEEGQFLDQSRNISDLQEGRVNRSAESSTKKRLEELQRRNTLCRPHLRTHYPVETQQMPSESIVSVEDITRTPNVVKKTTSAPLQSTSYSENKLPEGQHRKRKEYWQPSLWTTLP